jgi:fatty acid desaturase
MIVFTGGGYGASGWVIAHFEALIPLLAGCLGFTFFSVQLAGLMHDSGHRAVFASQRANNILGYASCALLVMVFDSWRERHNAHHAHPNQEGKDPDLKVPLIAASARSFRAKGSFERFLMKWQAYYYFPLGGIVGITNRVGSVTYFFRHPLRKTAWQCVAYILGIAFLFVVPFVAFSLEKAILVFVVVHFSSGVYMASCFAPNHKGMPQLAESEVMSFFQQQVVTSRNIRGGFWTELLMVGLNHQVEHHLFPTCPRNKLRLLKPYVQQVCRAAGLSYSEVGIIETNRLLITELRRVARAPVGS